MTYLKNNSGIKNNSVIDAILIYKLNQLSLKTNSIGNNSLVTAISCYDIFNTLITIHHFKRVGRWTVTHPCHDDDLPELTSFNEAFEALSQLEHKKNDQ